MKSQQDLVNFLVVIQVVSEMQQKMSEVPCSAYVVDWSFIHEWASNLSQEMSHEWANKLTQEKAKK